MVLNGLTDIYSWRACEFYVGLYFSLTLFYFEQNEVASRVQIDVIVAAAVEVAQSVISSPDFDGGPRLGFDLKRKTILVKLELPVAAAVNKLPSSDGPPLLRLNGQLDYAVLAVNSALASTCC